MPQGYYTIEQWTPPEKGAPCEWVAILDLLFGTSLTDAETAVKQLGKPGLFRLVHMQRVIWAEADGKDLRLRKSHASSPASLDTIRKMFERCSGQYPLEEVKEARRRAKRKRATDSQ